MSLVFSTDISIEVSPTGTAVLEDTCPANCSVGGDPANPGYVAAWFPRGTFNNTLVATVITIINTDANTTQVSTAFDEQGARPSGTNADGTLTQLVTYTSDGTATSTEIAFPTQFDVIPQQWIWSGILSTLDSDGTPACVTHTTDAGTFSINYFSQTENNVMSIEAAYADDVRGWNFRPNHVDRQWTFTSDAVPGQAALSSPPEGCTQGATAPLVEQIVDSWFVDTVTMTTGNPIKSSTAMVDVGSSSDDTTQPDAPSASAQSGASTRTIVSEGSSGAETATETVTLPSTTTSRSSKVSVRICALYFIALLAMACAL